MELELSGEARRFIEECVSSGEFSSASEVIEAGIARLMLDPKPRIDGQTFAEIREGVAQLDRGESIPWRDLRAELLAKHPPK